MMDGNPPDAKVENDSPIVDHTLVYTWNATEEKYEPAFRGALPAGHSCALAPVLMNRSGWLSSRTTGGIQGP